MSPAEHEAGMDGEIVSALRDAAKRVTGGNCAFADSDLKILEHLAERAVQAGLTDQLHRTVLNNLDKRFARGKYAA